MKTYKVIGVSMVVGMLLAACALASAQAPVSDTMTPSMLPENTPIAPSTSAASGTVNIDIQNYAFQPATITIKVGTKVTWTNLDAAPHTATSDTGIWDSGRLAQNATFSWVFDKAGTFAYHCIYHSMMLATIVVIP
jgi:plastocyanin